MLNKDLMATLRAKPADATVELYAPSAGPGISEFSDVVGGVNATDGEIVAGSAMREPMTVSDLLAHLETIHDMQDITVLIPEMSNYDTFTINDVWDSGPAVESDGTFVVIQVDM